MSNTIRQFDYEITKMGKKEPLPFNPRVEIVLAQWSARNKDEPPIISAYLMTENEIDFHIKALKDDLDAVGRKAKTALRKAIDEARSYKSN